MNEVKHSQTVSAYTPGPWKATLNFGQWYVRQDPVDWDGMGYQSIGLVGRFHADRKGTHYGDMFKANAMLIAAAPDLVNGINALLGLLSLLNHRDDIPEDAKQWLRVGHRIDEANAALKKAGAI